jgi:hypothetical protein
MNYNTIRNYLQKRGIPFEENNPYSNLSGNDEQLKCFESFSTIRSLIFKVKNDNETASCFISYNENKLAKKTTYDISIIAVSEMLNNIKVTFFYKILTRFIESDLSIKEVIDHLENYEFKQKRLKKITNQIKKLQEEKLQLEKEIEEYEKRKEENKENE